jgi:5-formaminoimidazole-4-carboxamide-1-beta-D-ribofuranosyl 5'-monophosphate synthetase
MQTTLPLPRFTADELDDVDHSKTMKLDEVTLRRGKLPTVEQIAKYREVRARRTGATSQSMRDSFRASATVPPVRLARTSRYLAICSTVGNFPRRSVTSLSFVVFELSVSSSSSAVKRGSGRGSVVMTQPSKVRLTARIKVLDMKSRHVLGTQVFEAVEPAPSENAYGAVQATNAAVQKILGEMVPFALQYVG